MLRFIRHTVYILWDIRLFLDPPLQLEVCVISLLIELKHILDIDCDLRQVICGITNISVQQLYVTNLKIGLKWWLF